MKKIIQNIQSKYGIYTKKQKIMADFIIENYAIIPFETLNEIAKRAGVSTTSLIRFSRVLGYRDYSDLKKSIQESIKGKVSLPARLSEVVQKEDNLDDLLNKCGKNVIKNVKATIGYQKQEDLKKAVKWICDSENVYVLGLRSCFAPAFYLSIVLSQAKKSVHLIEGIASTYPEEIINIKENDIVIVFSFPRFYKETLNLTQFIRRRGAKVILITSTNNESVKQYGDVLIPCATDSISFKDSFAAVFLIIDYLVASVVASNKPDGMKVTASIEEILSQNYFIGF